VTQLIDRDLLAALAEQAGQAPRRRSNHNFHPADDYPGHRLLIAIEPDSYVVPHCHHHPHKDESLVCLRGRLGVLLFTPEGAVDRQVVLEPGGDVLGIDIPHGVLHSVLALESGTVFFEAKAGPYVPLAADERAAWAPPEGTLAVLAGLFG
jgi:cupin fold WbuC family metalloprotein